MKNYWLDQATLCVKESHFEVDEQYGVVIKTVLSNGCKLDSWMHLDGTLVTGRSGEFAAGRKDFELQERLAEEKFGTMVSHNWSDAPAEPLTGSFTFFPSTTEVWTSPNIEVVSMGDLGMAVKFLSRLNHTDYPCYLEADINELAEITGTMYVTCPAGQLVMEKAKMWSTHTINGYYLFVPSK